jgi:geranylgeranyl pyrophosphate synthase
LNDNHHVRLAGLVALDPVGKDNPMESNPAEGQPPDRSMIPSTAVSALPDGFLEMADSDDLAADFSEIRRRVIDVGTRLLPTNTTYPVHLNTELRESAVTRAGKLVRPCLAVVTAHLTGGDVGTAYRYGWAIELLHFSSLILDDLPSMDDSKYRRGRLTVHLTHGEGYAILLACQAHNVAMQIIGKSSPTAGTGIQFFNATHEALGGMGLIGGQALDLEFQTKEPNFGFAEGYRKRAGFRDLWTMCAHFKTASLFRLSIYAGCLTAPMEQEDIETLCRSGDRIGLVFQLLDDEADHDISTRPNAAHFQTLLTPEQRLDEARVQRTEWREELQAILGERGERLSRYFDLVVPIED